MIILENFHFLICFFYLVPGAISYIPQPGEFNTVDWFSSWQQDVFYSLASSHILTAALMIVQLMCFLQTVVYGVEQSVAVLHSTNVWRTTGLM